MSTEEEEILEFEEEDILEEINFDEEVLPDSDEDVVPDEPAANIAEKPADDDSIRIFSRHTGELYCVACSPTDETLVATGGGDDKGFLWKIIDDPDDFARELGEGHKDSVSCLAFSADGSLLATGSLDGVIQIWDISSGGGDLKCTFDDPEAGVEWVKWHPTQHAVLAGTEDGTVWLWCSDGDEAPKTFFGHSESVTCGDFTPDGKTICTGSDDKTLRIWDPATGKNMHVVKDQKFFHKEGLTCMSISSDSIVAITASQDGSVCIVKIETGKVINSLVSHNGSVECMGLSASSFRLLATAGLDETLVIWDLTYSTARCTCEHEGGVTCLVWLGDSPYVVTGGMDGKLSVWDSLSGQCVKTFSGHSDAIQSVSVSTSFDYLVSVCIDKTARVFDIRKFKPVNMVNVIDNKMSSLNVLK